MMNLEVVWKKKENLPGWFDQHRSGAIFFGDQEIGSAGMVSRSFCKALSDKDLFIFELDARFLSGFERKVAQYQAWSKYQDV
jgi:phenylalanyl-tRNA synthetase beta subunit